LDLLGLQDQKELQETQVSLVKMVRRENREAVETKDHQDYLEEQDWMESEDPKEILDNLDHLEMMEDWEELVHQVPLDLQELWLREKRFQDLLAQLGWMGHQVCPEILDLKEKWVPEGIKDNVEQLVKMVCVVLLDYKERRAELVTLVLLVSKVKREIWEMPGKWGHQEFKELQVWQDNLVNKVSQECLVILVHQEDREILDLQVPMARMDLMVKRVTLVHLETEGSLAKMDVQEYKV